MRKYLKNKWMMITEPKFALHGKIINKTRTAKNQKNSTQCYTDNYLTNHLVKFL